MSARMMFIALYIISARDVSSMSCVRAFLGCPRMAIGP